MTEETVYDQEFFLCLARPRPGEAHEQIRDRWNAWRPEADVPFSKIDFSCINFSSNENNCIDFSGFLFLFDVNFHGSTFKNSNFKGAKFLGKANFSNSSFEERADFSNCIFKKRAIFLNMLSPNIFHFSNCLFYGFVDFSTSINAYERASRVQLYYSFGDVDFSYSKFYGITKFSNRHFGRSANFSKVIFKIPPDFSGSTGFGNFDLSGCRVTFDYGESVICPSWTAESRIVVRIREFRSSVELVGNQDFAADLFIEERKAERGVVWHHLSDAKDWGGLVTHGFWIIVMGAYWALSDYGRSFLRPTVWLGASIPAFDFLYEHLLTDRRETAGKEARKAVEQSWDGKDALAQVKALRKAECTALRDYDATVWQLALSNTVPFVGPLTIDADAKKFLLCGTWPGAKVEASGAATTASVVVELCRPIPPPGYQLTMISQNLFSIILVFFIGLALRNYFRLK